MKLCTQFIMVFGMLFGTHAAYAEPEWHQNLMGIWAMKPLSNGTANVIEIKANHQAILYPFRCDEHEKTYVRRAPLMQTYRLEGAKLYVIDEGEKQPYMVFNIDELKHSTMRLKLTDSSRSQVFEYHKQSDVQPLCTERSSK